MKLFEVQTRFGNSWGNCWSEEGNDGTTRPQYFDTHDDAMAGIYEFFADLSRAGMAQSYSLEDYRVRPVDTGAVKE